MLSTFIGFLGGILGGMGVFIINECLKYPHLILSAQNDKDSPDIWIFSIKNSGDKLASHISISGKYLFHENRELPIFPDKEQIKCEATIPPQHLISFPVKLNNSLVTSEHPNCIFNMEITYRYTMIFNFWVKNGSKKFKFKLNNTLCSATNNAILYVI